MAQDVFRTQPDVTAPYGTTNNKQARGADGSGPQFAYDSSVYGATKTVNKGDGAAETTLGNSDGIGTNDDTSLPKLYHYEIQVTNLANTGNAGNLSHIESEDSSLTVDAEPEGLQTERGNMRFGSIIDHLGIMANLYEFRVETSAVVTTGNNVGTVTGAVPKYHAYFETKPIWRVNDTTTLDHDSAVKRAVATALATEKTELRHVWYDADASNAHQVNNTASPAQKIQPIRQSVTAAAISTVTNLETNSHADGFVTITVAADSAT